MMTQCFSKNLFLSFIIGIFLLSACSPKTVVEVKKIENVYKYSPEGVFYALPQSAIRIHVEVEKQEIKKGIYAEYAEQLLGVSAVYANDETHWKINRIWFEQFPLIDTNQVYRITASNTDVPFLINLTPEGFLHSCNNSEYQNLDYEKQEEIQTEQEQNIPEIKNFVFSKNYKLKQVVDTVYKEAFRDSMVVMEPTLVRRTETKSKFEQAQDMAKLIFTLNDDIHAITIGDGYTEDIPDGKALEIILLELKAKVKNYYRMFTGTMKRTKHSFSFEYIPLHNKDIQADILFRFSEKRGILSSSNMDGEPIFVEITREGTQKKIRTFADLQKSLRYTQSKKDEEFGLVYRIPEAANMRLYSKSKVFFNTNLFLPQLGEIQRLPLGLITNPGVQILFYPELGGIKSIRKSK